MQGYGRIRKKRQNPSLIKTECKEMSVPSYLATFQSGELDLRIAAAREILHSCRLCPRHCRIDRSRGEKGICRTGAKAVVCSSMPHFGEEAPLVGSGGSGTVFVSHCSLRCNFCQNYEISHLGEGREVTDEQLAFMMVDLQQQGCQNINFVTPTHIVPQILSALPPAIRAGLSVPLIYNSSGYESVATLRLLSGVFDIYLPDFKFWEPETGKRLANAPDYPQQARAAVREMHRQVGDLLINEQGAAVRGLLVRHLVMPEGLSETAAIMAFLGREISTDTYVNVMDQYRPCGRAGDEPAVGRPPTKEEYDEAVGLARAAGLQRLDQREWHRVLRWF